MDTLIKNGDLFIDGNGSLVSITDENEKMQRILFILSTAKGSFSFDRELGSRLYTLGDYSDEQADSAALEIAADALVGVEGVSLESASVVRDGTNYEIGFTMSLSGRKKQVKIKL